MHTQPYVIELLEDVVISRRAATQGGHESLDYVPGQTLLGACAARLYKALGDRAYAVFHSGVVRFGNATCLEGSLNGGGVPTWPMPLCWHQKKAESAAVQSRLDDDSIYNFQHCEDPRSLLGGAQPKQLRDGYVSGDGRLHMPARVMRMKTAIEPGTGRAAQAQFFGYQALTRGTRLGGWIEADADIERGLLDQVIEALTGTLLLGRSRSAEYGQAAFTPADPGFAPPPAGTGPAANPGRFLTLWLLSDLALMDDNGAPTLEPSPGHLGLGAGEVDWSGTFIRIRRYAPWNGKRGAPDMERWVIQQGSVIRLRLDSAPDRTALLNQCAGGLGLHRECGLGRVWVDPPLLDDIHPQFEPAAPEDGPGDARETLGASSDPLIHWLRSQVEGEGSRERIERAARSLASTFGEKVQQARREKGIDKSEVFGPSRSQWGRVLETARSPKLRTGPDLLNALFTGEEAVIKAKAEGWQETFFNRSAPVTLAAWLKQQLEGVGEPHDLPRLVQRLAHHCRTDLERRAQ